MGTRALRLCILVLAATSTGLQQATIASSFSNQQGSQANSTVNQQQHRGDSISTTTFEPLMVARNSDFGSALRQFESLIENRADGSMLNGDSVRAAAHGEQSASPIHTAQAQRKLIRSRYRLRSGGGELAGQQQQQQQLANFSQPFDSQPVQSVPSLPANHQPALARALTGNTPNSGAIDSPLPYAYLAAPSQRAPAIQQTGSESASSNNLLLDEPTSLNQDNLVDYTPPLQQGYTSASSRMFPATGRAHSFSAATNELPYFLASPSMSSAAYGDYGYSGSASLDHHHHPSHHTASATDHDLYGPPPPSMLLGNYSDQLSFASSPYYSTPSGGLADPSAYLGHHSSGRNRWSWPWSDVSAFQNLPASPMTSASFKKHHFHHHTPKEYKEHDHHHHHEEHDHLMSKWEHGISIGEIACIAVAVVLGIIILGTPFFLLFLMLFNGGNLFGGTQMGLLAPAAAAGGAPAATGRRRRRRRSADGGGFSEDELAKFGELDVHGMGEYLFERLSPFLDADKLMRSFGRMMGVRDDIERIIAKLAERGQGEASMGSKVEPDQRQHIEMRRKRKK
mgnify:CR=1 FL=1